MKTIVKLLQLKLNKKEMVIGKRILGIVMIPIFVLQMCSVNLFLTQVARAEDEAVITETAPAPKEEPKVEATAPVEKPAPVVKEENPAPTETVAPVVTSTSKVVEPIAESVSSTETPVVSDTSTTSTTTEQPSDETVTTEPTSVEAPASQETAVSEPTAEIAESTTTETVVPTTTETPAETWSVDGNKATTNNPVEKDVKYIAPQNDQVTVTFTKLPDNPGTLSVEEITLTDEQVASLGALSNKAYDITSDMADGTFKYDLTLPSFGKENAQIKYAEKESQLDDAKTISDVDVKSDTVEASGIDHFTIFYISADDTGGTYTSTTGPAITEAATGNISTGTLILNVPSGFRFRTSSNVTATVTAAAGSGSCNSGRSLQLNGSSSQTVTPTQTAITINVTRSSTGTCRETITWSGIATRPTSGTPISSGDITLSGTATIGGATFNTNKFIEIAGDVNAANSTVVASPASVPADNSTTSTIIVTLKDFFNNPISGKNVSLTRTSGPGSPNISASSGPSDATGVVTFTVRSGTAGTDIFTAIETSDSPDVTITQKANVIFTSITGTVKVIKHVVNDNGGTATASNFSIHVKNGTTEVSSSPASGSESGRTYTLNAGTYTLSETGGPSGYSASSWVCTGDGTQNGNQITIGIGNNATCTITNDDIQPKITVTKIVNGGTANVSDFPLFVGSTSVTSGVQIDINAGTYNVHETNQAGYTGVVSGNCASNGNITLAPGDVKSCTITNTRDTGSIQINKRYDDDSDGNFEGTNSGANSLGFRWIFNGDGTERNMGSTLSNIETGTYFITENDGNVPDYHFVGWYRTGVGSYSCSNPEGTTLPISLSVLRNQTTDITLCNAHDSGTITVIKSLNPSSDSGRFNLLIDGNFPSIFGSGFHIGDGGSRTLTVNTGDNHSVSEMGTLILPYTDLNNYSSSIECKNGGDLVKSGDGANLSGITVKEGDNVICTITNNRKGRIIVKKEADPAGSGTSTNFDFYWGVVNRSESTEFNLSEGGQYNTVYIAPGNYWINEPTMPTGWDRGSFSCDNGDTDNANVTLDPGKTVTCTFTNIKQGSISGTKFNDLNGNSVRDANENGINGWEIFIDKNLNGIFDGHDNEVSTDSNGNYSFPNLSNGDYQICEIEQTGWRITYPAGSNCQTVTVSQGENATADFGNQQFGSIVAHKYEDRYPFADGNNQVVGIDTNLANWEMSLYSGDNCQGASLATGTTGTDGNYTFSNIIAGNYSVKETLQDHWQNITDICQNITVSGGNDSTVNFGNFLMGSINVCKYQDHNGNGSWNPGDAGIQGWEMTAYNTTTDKTYTMLTASDGCALFTDLPYGIYDVSEEVRDGWIKTSPSSSDPRRIWITASNSINGIGYYNFQLGTISGQKFNDINNNGVKDPGEIGLAGWTINLDLNADSSVEQTAVTDVDGNYTFTNLVAGTYRVREQAQDGWAQTTTNPQDITIQSGSVVAGIDFGNVQMGKIIIEKQTIPDGSTQSFEFTPSYSEKFSLTDGNTNDSGYLLPGTYSISETAMEDWDLTNVVCDDGSSIDAISISPNETVTCTFTNTQRGKITVIKKTEGDTGKTFPFVTDFAGTFNLGQNGVWTSGFLLPGKTYTVFEGNLYHSHWYFDKLECVDSTQQANIVQFKDTANISLNPGSDVICTFYNSYSQDDSNGGGGGNGGGGANNAGGGIAGILGTGGGGGGNATTGGGSVEGASTEGGEQPTTGGNEGGQVLGVEAQQCASWPLWAWILLLIAFAGIFNFAVWNLYKEIKTIKWFWPLVWMIGGLGVWYFYDGCRTFMWFPYVTVILAAISYILYIYKMKQISK